MTRVALPLCALASALLAGSLTMAASPEVGVRDVNEIEKVERARFAAWIKGDAAVIEPMLADDLLYCHASGVCQSKQEIMDSIRSKETEYKQMNVVSFKPRALGSDGVLINGKVHVIVIDKGKELNFQAVYTDAYVKRGGKWQLVSWQSTRIS